MGNGCGKLSSCFVGAGESCRKQDCPVFLSDPLDEGLGHSFCYVRPDPSRLSSSKVHSEETTTFKTISGASVSANTSTPLSTALVDLYSYNSIDRAAAFESSTSFASIPLQPIPRNSLNSGPYWGNIGGISASGPLERGFMSGPIERGFMSGPIERGFMSGPIDLGIYSSGPMEKEGSDQFRRNFSHGGFALRPRSKKGKLIRVLQRAIAIMTISRGQNSMVAPIRGVVSVKEPDWNTGSEEHNENLTINSVNCSSVGSMEDYESMESQNLQWAQGKAGEDRVQVVVSEEHGWVFVGIYDGFNGPDAPDYLLSNLYSFVHKELKGLLWDEKHEPAGSVEAPVTSPIQSENPNSEFEDSSHTSDSGFGRNLVIDSCSPSMDENWDSNSKRTQSRNSKGKYNQRRWRCKFDRERVELDRRLKEQLNSSGFKGSRQIDHTNVLKALSQALRKTEEAYLDIADKMLMENPELALMGSCVLVMLMKGEDLYVMNVGDSRAVLAQKTESDYWFGKIGQDLERINEEALNDLEGSDGDRPNSVPTLTALQLTKDHSTSVEEEVQRIRSEHPDDACAVVNDRVKGSLMVTRAFGAGFLKQPKWNDALLEMFRIDYIGTSSYINCFPCLHHHRLGPKDRFLILSSDGLYQYFTNEEAVSEVELFIQLQPEGDPAQHLVEELLFRAAKKAGMDFHELLEIPQGDRRRYHDDVSIIVISLEGRIWRSCV